MIRRTCSLLATAILALSSTGHARVDDGANPQGIESLAYRATMLSSATALSCDAAHSFSDSIALCDVSGCDTFDITEQQSIAFRASKQGYLNILARATVKVDGVLRVDSDAVRLRAGRSSRFTLTVVGAGSCLKSVVYDVRLAR